jgi:hypothetical protein
VATFSRYVTRKRMPVVIATSLLLVASAAAVALTGVIGQVSAVPLTRPVVTTALKAPGHARAKPTRRPIASTRRGPRRKGSQPAAAHALSPAAGVSTPATGQRWMIERAMLSQLASSDPTAAASFFNTPQAFVFGKSHIGYAATSIVYYSAYASLAKALSGGTLPAGVQWVLYDNEDWSATPLVEQQHPAYYMRAFASLAHAHGLLVVETPARDLMNTPGADCTRQRGETLDQAYIRCQIPADARYADIFEVQAQADEGNAPEYAWLVGAARDQVLGVNRATTVMAGLTTDRGFSVAQIVACWQAARPIVKGFWMNTTTTTVALAGQVLDSVHASGG